MSLCLLVPCTSCISVTLASERRGSSSLDSNPIRLHSHFGFVCRDCFSFVISLLFSWLFSLFTHMHTHTHIHAHTHTHTTHTHTHTHNFLQFLLFELREILSSPSTHSTPSLLSDVLKRAQWIGVDITGFLNKAVKKPLPQ